MAAVPECRTMHWHDRRTMPPPSKEPQTAALQEEKSRLQDRQMATVPYWQFAGPAV